MPDIEAFEVWRLGLAPGEEPQGSGSRHHALQARLLEAKGTRLFRLEEESIESHTRGPSLEIRDDLLHWYEEEKERFPLVAWYAVRTVCCGGQVSQFSNVARLVPRPPPQPPSWGEPEAQEKGITLRWEGAPAVIVERARSGGEWSRVTAEAVTGGEWTDTDATAGSSWKYRLRSVVKAGSEPVVGEAGEVLEVVHPDVYPPEAPKNLVCLPEPTAVRLRWSSAVGATNYRVFRRIGDQAWRQLDRHVPGLEYVDARPPTGVVTYAIRAVDPAGNESEPTSCVVTVSGNR